MDQKQRDKIAWVLAPVLGVILVYLLAVNVFKIGKKNAFPPASAITRALPAQPLPPPASAPVPIQEPDPALDLEVLAEQQRIAARLPRRNPFRAMEVGQQTPNDRRQLTDNGQLTSNSEIKLKVSAIISRAGSSQRIAMINGKMIEEGDRIGEWTVLQVNPNNVVLGNGSRQMAVGVK